MLENQIAGQVEKKLRESGLPLRVRLWNDREVAATPEAKVTLALHSPSQLRLLLRPNLSRIAESYVEQEIDVDGHVRDIVNVFADFFGTSAAARTGWASRLRWRRHTKRSDKKAIESHYDVCDEFFALWLDTRRVYSCGYFRAPEESLETAQENKLEHICRKLLLKPGERFLDVGCGWGGLLLWAAERYAVRATGITVSDNQYAYVRQLVAERGLGDRVEVRLMDYRDLPEHEPFDKIASVGMFEHVGRQNLPMYFRKIHNLLEPGGLMMNQGITSATFEGEEIAGGGRAFI